ncbi:MAG: SEL1-like repeat protein, partial [Myxococcales bacterium]|nr:SEL1-like repeat protein [Myxococcales bacterium]
WGFLGSAFMATGRTEDESCAQALMRRGCEGGNAPACASLAKGYYFGKGAERDLGRALRLAVESCDDDARDGCYLAGAIHRDGTGVPVDRALAAAFFERGCVRYHAHSCHMLGKARLAGEGGPIDRRGAATLFRRACNAGVAEACVDLGRSMEEGEGIFQDLDEAQKLYEGACANGVATGCLRAGLFLGAHGSPPDVPLQKRFFEAACKHESGLGCHELAQLEVEGLAPDAEVPKMALEHYEKACRLGVGDGCWGVAWAKRDEPRAWETWMVKACDLDSAGACFALGKELTSSDGPVGLDVPRAKQLFDKSCALDDGRGCSASSFATLQMATSVDERRQALALAEKGCRLGHGIGCAMAADIYLNLPDVVDVDADKAAALTTPSCEAGDAAACRMLASADLARGRLEQAIPGLTRAIEQTPEDAFRWGARGRARFLMGLFAEAEADFQQAMAVANKHRSYFAFWLFLSKSRRHDPQAKKLLRAELPPITDPWERALGELLAGDIDRAGLLAKAEDPDPEVRRRRLCEAHFFIGEVALLRGRKAEAREAFRLTVETDVRNFFEWQSAKVELRKLEASP